MNKTQSGEDVWIPSVCRVCPCNCGIQVHRQNGIIVKIEGDPRNPHNSGRICAKGIAHLMTLYDPNRIIKPLQRTNPAKGLGIDPRWEEISWEKAIELVVSRMRSVLKDDPRKLVIFNGNGEADWVNSAIEAFAIAFGTPNWSQGASGGSHVLSHNINNGSMHTEVDWDRCRLLILFGSQKGGIAGHDMMRSAKCLAEAREQSLKLIVVDPICSPIASKAQQWLPIRPGTDGALALSMLHVLLNEEKVYDKEFLQQQTNAAYLVNSSGHYVRDQAMKKPLVWNLKHSSPVPFDDPDAGDTAIEGEYYIGKQICHPAFQCLREHLKQYFPEKAAEITTIPAKTIRSLANDFGQTASIGSTVVMGGKELPLRPVCAFPDGRGATSHRYGLWSGTAIEMLNVVVGAVDMPGGVISTNVVGPGERLRVSASSDGLIVTGSDENKSVGPYPPRNPRLPSTLHLREIFPVGQGSLPTMIGLSLSKYPYLLSYKPEVFVINFNNALMSANTAMVAEVLKQVPFTVFLGDKLHETAEFADIVIPTKHIFEKLDFPANSMRGWITGDHWYFTLRQPVVEPVPGIKHVMEVFLELAERLGLLDKIYERLNSKLQLNRLYHLNSSDHYSIEEILNRRMKSMFGEEKGLEWFKRNGFFSFPRTLAERFPRGVMSMPRLPVYFEFLIEAGKQFGRIANELRLEIDTSSYKPLPVWDGCMAHREGLGEYDLFAVNYKLPFHASSITQANPWLEELTSHNPYAYKIWINGETAQKRGISEGTTIIIESVTGKKAKGKAKLSQCIHPEVVGIASSFGHWARGLPVARGRGIHFNSLVPYGLNHMDLISVGMDLCTRVKVYEEKS